MNDNIKLKIYQEIERFLDAFKRNDSKFLNDVYDIPENLLEEINEFILEETENKHALGLFPVSDIDKRGKGRDMLSIQLADNVYIVECDIWLNNQESDLVLLAEYHLDDHFPKLEFRNFDF